MDDHLESTVSSAKRPADDSPVPASPTKRVKQTSPAEQIQDVKLGYFLDISTFLVGFESVAFYLHWNLLGHRCSEFAKTLSQGQADEPTTSHSPTSRVFHLPLEEPRVFQQFLAWLYFQELPASPPDENATPDDMKRLVPGEDAPNARFCDQDLIHLHLFGMRNNITTLATSALNCLQLQNLTLQRTTSNVAVISAYKHLNISPTLSDYLVNEALSQLGCTHIPQDLDAFPNSYVIALFQALQQRNIQMASSDSQSDTSSEEEIGPTQTTSRTYRYGLEVYTLLSDVAVVVVSNQSYPFVLHKGLLCSISTACKTDCENGKDRFEIPDLSVHDFAIFTHWLYTHQLRSATIVESRLLEEFLGERTGDTPSTRRPWQPQEQTQDTQLVVEENSQTTVLDLAGDESAQQHHNTSIDQFALRRSASGVGTAVPDTDLHGAPDRIEMIDGQHAPPEPATNEDQAGLPCQHQAVEMLPQRQQRRHTYVSLFIMAERNGIRLLKNAIMDKLVARRREGKALVTAEPYVIQKAYNELHADAAICKYMAEEAAMSTKANSRTLAEACTLPAQFLSAVWQIMVQERSVQQPKRPKWEPEMCKFHDHGGSEEEAASCRARS